MTHKDFWRNSTVAVLGGGSWGTVLAHLVAHTVRECRLWVRTEAQVRSVSSTRQNEDYAPGLVLHPKVTAMHELARIFEGGVDAILWALPSASTREVSRLVAPLLTGREILIHASKGIEQGSLKRISEILREELPCPRIGVLSGPNLAHEIARGEPAATVIASRYTEVIESGRELLSSERLRVYHSNDVIGVEWAGTLKNILAIASGALDAKGLGWNARSMLITRGLAEMVRFGCTLGGQEATFLGLAGVGDLLATCSSPLSRNYRVGHRLGKGESLEVILADLGSTAEGVGTTRSVAEFAKAHSIEMPITSGVYALLDRKITVDEAIRALMMRPPASDQASTRF
jgi:glycerol-3-phosphate dehydrogenase (NAD(P)+)